MHIKVEELQRNENSHVSSEKLLRDGIITVTNYVKGGLEEIKQSNNFSQGKMSLHTRDPTLKDLMASVERAYAYLY